MLEVRSEALAAAGSPDPAVLGFRVQGLRFRVYMGLGFRVLGFGFRVQGLGPGFGKLRGPRAVADLQIFLSGPKPQALITLFMNEGLPDTKPPAYNYSL